MIVTGEVLEIDGAYYAQITHKNRYSKRTFFLPVSRFWRKLSHNNEFAFSDKKKCEEHLQNYLRVKKHNITDDESAKVHIYNVKSLPDGDWAENIIRAEEKRFEIYFWRAVALFFFLTTLVFAFGGETEGCVKKAMAVDAVRLAYAQGQQDLILEVIE